MANPVQLTMANQCESTDYVSNAALCGIPNSRPTPLVTSIKVDNGVSRDGADFVEQTDYDYFNSRIFPGVRSKRVDLGFSWIKKTNHSTGAYNLTWLRQDRPYQGRPYTSYNYNALGHGDGYTIYNYSASSWPSNFEPPSDQPAQTGETVTLASVNACAQEDGAALPCLLTTYSWDDSLLLNGTTINSNVPGSNPITRLINYAGDDASWFIKPVSTWSYRRNGAGTNIILGMTKIAYSTQALREFEPSEIDRLLFPDSETATCACAASGNCAPEEVGTCSAEISAGSARWVAVYQNPPLRRPRVSSRTSRVYTPRRLRMRLT
jgi:hypothetical protein